MSLFSAPFESFYSKKLYRNASLSSVGQGFVYLLYFSALIMVLSMLIISMTVVPEANRFMGWVKINMPVLEITPGQSPKMDRPSPYQMVHPEYGNLAYFDMSKAEVPLEEIKDWKLYMTSTKAYFQKENGQFQIHDLVGEPVPEGKKVETRTLDAAFVQKVENIVKPVLLIVAAALIFVLFFIWKLLTALFYSLIGMVLNLQRRERFSYGQILNVSFLAITPAAWIQFFSMLKGVEIPFGFFWTVALTSAYLFFGIRRTEEEQSEPSI